MGTKEGNATMKRDVRGICGHRLRAGDRAFMFHERALSFGEARHAGAYPWRYMCVDCARARGKIEA